MERDRRLVRLDRDPHTETWLTRGRSGAALREAHALQVVRRAFADHFTHSALIRAIAEWAIGRGSVRNTEEAAWSVLASALTDGRFGVEVFARPAPKTDGRPVNPGPPAPHPPAPAPEPIIDDDRALRILRCDPQLLGDGQPLRFEYLVRELEGKPVQLRVLSETFPGKLVHERWLTADQTRDRVHADTWDGEVSVAGEFSGQQLPSRFGPCTLELVHDATYRDSAPFSLVNSTWFEVYFQDELGQGLPDVSVQMMVDGSVELLTTDGLGKARFDGATTSFATARPASDLALRSTLEERWIQARDGEWKGPPDLADHTFIPYAEPATEVALRNETPHTVVLQPRVARARLVGGMFDTNKSFLLPSALPSLRSMVSLYGEHPNAELLIVGHTDISGDPSTNDPLSLERAEAVKAYLADDVDAWLEWYGSGKPSSKRWGEPEDAYMLQTVLLHRGEFAVADPARHYQGLRGLTVDGVVGPNTRRALVTDYMAVDGTTLPEGVTPQVHGCGENFPLADDGEPLAAAASQDDALDRRVELFFFDEPLGVLPPPPGKNSGPGSREYPEWRKRSRKTNDYLVRQAKTLAVKAIQEATKQSVPGAKVTLSPPEGEPSECTTNEYGVAMFEDVFEGSYSIYVEESSHDPCSLDYEVGPDDPPTGVEAPLTAKVGSLVVTVTDDGAVALAAADVRITGPSGEEQGVVTEADGTATFDDLPVGTYEVKATSHGFTLVTTTVEVVADATTPLPVVLVSTDPQKYELTELVEVVTRGGTLGTVGGAAMDTKAFPKHLDRTAKKGSAFKQFVNLDKDTDGAAKRHPEQGRHIELYARLAWVSGSKKKSLIGKQVKWKVTETKHSGAGRPASFGVAAERPGLGGKNGKLTAVSTADKDGWAKIELHLSQYAGDEYTLEAEVDGSDSEAQAKPAKKAGPYVVWRKFWYQMSKPHGSAVPNPTKAISAYEKVGADMVAADVLTFKKTDVPAPPARTFYPKGMTEIASASTIDVVLVGGHNRTWFWGKFNKETKRPVKGHLIICDGQWDPSSKLSSLQRFEIKARTQEITVNLGGADNAGILKPALSGNLLVSGSWSLDPVAILKYVTGITDPGMPPKPAKMTGTLSDANVTIPLPRTGLDKITITLPADAPDPTTYKIFVAFKVGYGKFYGGESEGINMLIVYRGQNKKYYQTVSHEFGHGFRQVPDKKSSASMANHSKQYDQGDGHGGSGSHCSTGSTTGPVAADASSGVYRDGTCIMFHQLSPSTCTQTFCAVCEPHLRIDQMDKLKVK